MYMHNYITMILQYQLVHEQSNNNKIPITFT